MKRRDFLKNSQSLSLGLFLAQFNLSQFNSVAPIFESQALTFQLDWKMSVQFAGLLWADYHKLYQEEGLTVKIKPWESRVDIFEAVTQDYFTLACAEQDRLLNAQADGKPLKAIATMLQSSPLGLMSLPQTPLNTLKDLQGKTIGVHQNGDKIINWLQDQTPLDKTEIDLKIIPYQDKFKRLLSGELDAIQCYITDEPIGFALQQDITPNILKFSDYGYDQYTQVIFTHRKLAIKYPDTLKFFLNCIFKGWKKSLENIPETAKLIVDNYIPDHSEYHNLTYQTQSLQALTEYLLKDISLNQLGRLDPHRWQSISQTLEKYQLISKYIPLEQSVDMAFLK